MPTLLCVPIMVHDVHAALADAQAAKDAGADLVEFRIDEFFAADTASHDPGESTGPTTSPPTSPTTSPTTGSADDIVRLVSQSPLPCILTCRHASEGGGYDGDEDARVSLYERLGAAPGTGEHPPRYLDFELDRYLASANIRQKVNLAVDASGLRAGSGQPPPSLILSNHDFNGRPADLSRRVLRMREQPAAVIKFAFRARSLRDNLEIFDLLSTRDRPTIALAMGEFGLMSRVLAPKFGGYLTFASLRSTSTTAPGQPTIRELIDLYRFRSIGPRTRVYGVVGWPVGHSRSPVIHNAGFEAVGHDGVYLPLPIAAHEGNDPDAGEHSYASFKATLLALLDHPGLDLGGMSVTIPHKENLVRLAREQSWEIDTLSQLCGSANTLAVASSSATTAPRIRVFNTDAPAALACLEEVIGPVKGQRIGVLGAGGVARSIVFALAQRGALVTIFNRSLPKAQHLAAAASTATGAAISAAPTPTPTPTSDPSPSDLASLTTFHAWINCTPIGMTGGPDPAGSPLPAHVLRNSPAKTAVLDTVYNPLQTPLLRQAAEAGWRTIDGLGMFVRQAAAQFEAWTGTNAPMTLFEKVVRESLGH